MDKKFKLLHISYDYAEENIGDSTVVIKDLIEESSKYIINKTIALKRTVNPKKLNLSFIDENLVRLTHFGFPYGIFLKMNSFRISAKIYDNLFEKFQIFSVDAIHSHKLTFEGFIGFKLSNMLDKKLIISVRQTDLKVLKYRKDLIPFAKKILEKASFIIYLAPYMVKRIENVFGRNFMNSIKDKLHFLPNPINFQNFDYKSDMIENYYITILWLNRRSVLRKNLFGLLKAIKLLDNNSIKLKIIGKGNYEHKLKRFIKTLGLESQVEFLGFKENSEIKFYLAKSRGLLLPSFSETFGVVYAEALLCGTPILYSINTGFDGLFENVGALVDPNSIESIANGIQFIDYNNKDLRKNIMQLKQSGTFNILKRENVGISYFNLIKEFI